MVSEKKGMDTRMFIDKKYNHKAFYLLIILFIIGVAAFWYMSPYFNWKKTYNGESVGIPKPDLLTGQNVLATNQLPRGITIEMLLDSKANVLDSYTYVKDGKNQSTVRFLTRSNIKEVQKSYEEWLKDNGWNLTPSEDESKALLFLNANKDGQKLYITAEDNKTGDVIVDLTLITTQ